MSAPVLPDVRLVVIDWLKNRPPLAALHAGNVSTRLPSANTAWPYVRVTRVGGRRTGTSEDTADVQVEVWGDDWAAELDLSLLARTIVAAVDDLRGPYPGEGAYVSDAENTLGPLPSPDPLTGRPRELLTISVIVHPLGGT